MEVYKLEDMMNRMSCRRQEPPQLEHFQFFQQLGRGAYGVVHHVRSKIDHQEYALKQMEIISGPDGIPQSVLREISIMKSISVKRHPNILGLRAVFHRLVRENAYVQINMLVEKCDWDLYTFLRDIPKNLPEHQCRHISAQLLHGIEFLHSHNIIHRDLKPQNILINRDQTVKIADFGLSRNYSNTSAFTTLVCTLWYRSPEILLQSYYDSSSDIWAVGCIISEIFSRQALFPAQNEADQLKLIFQRIGTPLPHDWPQDAVVDKDSFKCWPLKSIAQINPFLCQASVDLIDRCLKYNRLERLSARQALEHRWLCPQKRRVFQNLNTNQY
ncbi:unnamed protein product [Caenorhabditis angaria]|uniref:Protein kinase domain-containing protein n=1 Tax=Caenorhabditis angaria TaxID=860376 RepID=A0A9P1NB98_9PELO|nr:unnamed protein product [Caenorhabditis angaria]